MVLWGVIQDLKRVIQGLNTGHICSEKDNKGNKEGCIGSKDVYTGFLMHNTSINCIFMNIIVRAVIIYIYIYFIYTI